jgi:hypothetical protein
MFTLSSFSRREAVNPRAKEGPMTRHFEKSGAAGRTLSRLAWGSGALLLVALGLWLIDGREVLGAPTWLKPAKFAAAIGTAAATLAWMIQYLGPAVRGVRRATRVIVATATFELLVISIQAARGVPSHFNNRTTLDLLLFQAMGAAITAFWLAELYFAIRAFRTRFADPVLGWGIRLGLLATLAGGAQGFVMSTPTARQFATLKAGEKPERIGAHSVGVEDGGKGLPITRWSTEGGDLRVAHFFGLHGLQLLPALALGAARLRRKAGARAGSRAGERFVVVAGGAYLGLTVATFIQALRGYPLLRPEPVGLLAGAAVLLGFALLAWRLREKRGAALAEHPAAALAA